MACANGVSALTLPWTNVTVQASSSVPVRGVTFGVGTPPQSLSLWPSFGDNETWVPNSLDCNNVLSNLSCIAVDGGIYYTSNSSSYKFASQANWNGSQTLSGIHTYINDNVVVGSNATVWGMPLIQHVVNWDARSALGMGSGSSFLKSLVNQNLAPSRNFGLWTGSQSVNNPVDGSLVVGGYDASKVGSLTNFSSIQGCVACTLVTGLEVTLASGSTKSLLNSTIPKFRVTIDPYYTQGGVPVLGVPDEIRDYLVTLSQAILLPDPNVYGWRTGQQPGDVKVTFGNGYQVTIPGSELWLPPRTVNSAGQTIIQNNSQILNVLRGNGKYALSTYYTWGQPFLSTNYMVVWPDEGIWSLSPISNAQKIASSSIRNLCTDATPSAPASAPSSTTTPSNTDTNSSSSNIGAIAGGVVGGVLGLLLILILTWYFIIRPRRAKKRTANNYEPARTELQGTDTGYRQEGRYHDADKKPPLTKYSDHGGGVTATPELAGDENSWRAGGGGDGGGSAPSEVPGSPYRPVELQGSHVRS